MTEHGYPQREWEALAKDADALLARYERKPLKWWLALLAQLGFLVLEQSMVEWGEDDPPDRREPWQG